MALSRLRYLYWAYLSAPASDRVLYRTIRRQMPASIVELGIGDGRRTTRLLDVALRFREGQPVRYAGVDLFEARPATEAGLTLKHAYRLLGARGVQLRLAPGDPYSALARIANSLAGTDLLVIARDQDRESLERAWQFIPRMLHDRSLVFLQEPNGTFRRMSRDEIAAAAGTTPVRQAA